MGVSVTFYSIFYIFIFMYIFFYSNICRPIFLFVGCEAKDSLVEIKWQTIIFYFYLRILFFITYTNKILVP